MKRVLVFFCSIFLLVSSGNTTTSQVSKPSPFSPTQQFQFSSQMPVISAQPNLRFDCLTAADGLSYSLTISILQDKQGFMWFGTRAGINKYDGYNFTISFMEPGTNFLNDVAVRQIYADHLGNLWVVTRNDLVQMDGLTGRFIHYKREDSKPGSLGAGMILTVNEDSAGNIWVGTVGGIYLFDRKTEQFTRFLPDLAITRIYTDRQGGIWLGTFQGLRYYQDSNAIGKQPALEYRPDPNDPTSLSSDWIAAIFEDQQGYLWVGTLNSGLDRLDRTSGKFTHYQPRPDDPFSLSDNRITSILEDSTGRLWVGTNNGLNVFDQSKGGFYHYYYDPDDPQSLISNQIADIYQDRSGIIWFATFGGVCKLNDLASLFTHYQQAPEHAETSSDNQQDMPGLSDNQVSSIYQDDQGILWIGTYSGNLNRLDRSSGNVTVYRHDISGFSDSEVIAIFEDRFGTFWIGTSYGLESFDPRTGIFQVEEVFRNQFICSIAEDPRGNLWILSTEGVRVRASGTSTFIKVPEAQSLSNFDALSRMFIDKSGDVWISTETDGLYQLDMSKPAGSASTLFHYGQVANDPKSPGTGLILAIYEDAEGTIWLGSGNDGLIRYNRNDQTFTSYLTETGTPNLIGCIQEDSQGNLWLGTRLGLARFDPHYQTFQYYDRRDGLVIGESMSCYKNEQGEMFFGSWAGLTTFFPEKITINHYPPTIVITSINIDNHTLRTDLIPDEQVNLSYRENHLSFDFAALDFAAPAKNQYAYKMEGLDTDWVQAGIRRHAEYPDLKPGTYTFHVKASNSSGVWNEQGVAVQIKIIPPFWQTWWFRAIVASMAVLGILGVYGLRVKNIQAHNIALEKLILERTDEINHRRQEMEALYQADEELYRHLHLDDVLQTLVDIAVEILHADKGTLLVWDDNKEFLVPRASHGFNPSSLADMKIKPGMGIAGKVAVSGRPFTVEDSSLNPDVPHQITDLEGIRSFMQVPIQIKGETFGVFSADYVQPRKFNEQEQRLLVAIAQRAALAIQNAQDYEREQDMAVSEERSRLARELHDAVTQTLFSASLVAEALPTTWEKDPQEGRDLLQELRGLSRGALAEMRTLLLELRPAALLETRLEDLVHQLADAASGRAGVPVIVQMQGQCNDVPSDVHIAFYRITQEALNNVIKHARAHQVMIKLQCCDTAQTVDTQTEGIAASIHHRKGIYLTIRDDGRGFALDQIPHNRLGLGIMQERARAVGAILTIESQPGHGTQVTARWELTGKEDAE